MPGPCRPIELSMPLGVSAILGVGRPARGASITDFVTTAPILETSRNCASSRPEPAHPDAVRIGFGSSALPSRARRSVAMGQPLRARPPVRPAARPCARGAAPESPAARRDLGSQPGAPSASNGIVPTSSQRTCSPRNTGPSTHDRTIRVIPSVPVTGSTQVMQTPMPQAISSSTATCTGMS